MIPPTGTQDFYPKDVLWRTWLFKEFRESSRSFNFEEYDTPALESFELYERKAGEAGEEILEQIFSFKSKDGNKLALIPEVTPTLARLVLNRSDLRNGQVRVDGQEMPLKWFSIPRCWRNESIQRGRRREFAQWNVDIIGEVTTNAEVELLAVTVDFFRRVGLGPDIVTIKVNSRPLMEAFLAKCGVDEESFPKATNIIDKWEKISDDRDAVVAEQLQEIDVGAEATEMIIKALKESSIETMRDFIGSDSTAIQEVERVFELASCYGIREYLVFDASIVRGLSYYTGVVWEAFTNKEFGLLRAIMGGGRYDRLLQLYGGERFQIPCVGFGMGDCVIMELLRTCNKIPDSAVKSSGVDYVICGLCPDVFGDAFQIAGKIRQNGATVDLMLKPKKLKAALKLAEQKGARRMVFFDTSEIQQGFVFVKDLRLRVQKTCALDQLDRMDELFKV